MIRLCESELTREGKVLGWYRRFITVSILPVRVPSWVETALRPEKVLKSNSTVFAPIVPLIVMGMAIYDLFVISFKWRFFFFWCSRYYKAMKLSGKQQTDDCEAQSNDGQSLSIRHSNTDHARSHFPYCHAVFTTFNKEKIMVMFSLAKR